MVGSGLDPDTAAMELDDFFADGQADAGAGVFAAGVEALEYDEDAVEGFRVDADAVVLDRESPLVLVWKVECVDAYVRRGFAVKFEGVGDEVLEELGEHGRVAFYGGEGRGFDGGVGILDREFEVVADIGDEPCAIDRGEVKRTADT